jgi:glycerol-3-phosphate acyltransferase PlsY
MTWRQPALLVASYLVGSFNASYWVVRVVKGLDVRSVGSGNAGATNVLRAAGTRAGTIALLGDFAKGLGPVLFARAAGFHEPWPAAAALAVVLGHVFPVFLGFRGGKGVATAGGAFVALSPLAALATLLLFALVVAASRLVSLGSVLCAAVFPVLFAWLAPGPRQTTLACVAAVGALVLWTHRGNIGRLLAGSERRLGERR